MQSVSTSLPVLKYVYLVAFFSLTAGIFSPMIKNTDPNSVVFGILVLFIGLAGMVMLYKSFSSKYPFVFLGVGTALSGVSIYFIFKLVGLL